MANKNFNISVNSVMPGVSGYDLVQAIDVGYREELVAPIDLFIANGIEINKLLSATPSQVTGNLIILGYVSAIESYFRAIFRRLILIDQLCQEACEKRPISYGAVVSSEYKMLPEALFEEISFAGKKNITESFKNLLNLTVQESSLPPALSETLNQFSEICELRHCIVHRFGKFGSKNAISLGLSKHKRHIEKPIKCDFNMLNQLITVCHNTVRITNNFLAEKILSRLIISGNDKIAVPIWTWNYRTDQKLWLQYFKTFYSKKIPPSPNLTPKRAYIKYYNHYTSI